MATINHVKITQQQEKEVFTKYISNDAQVDPMLQNLVINAPSINNGNSAKFEHGQQYFQDLKHNETITIDFNEQSENKIPIESSIFTIEAKLNQKNLDANYGSLKDYELMIKNSVSICKSIFETNKTKHLYNALKGSNSKGKDYHPLFKVSKPTAKLNINSKDEFISCLSSIENHIEETCSNKDIPIKNVIVLVSFAIYNKVKKIFDKDEIVVSEEKNQFNYLGLIIKKDSSLKGLEFLAIPNANIIIFQPWKTKIKQNEEAMDGVNMAFGTDKYEQNVSCLFKQEYEYINILPDSCINGIAIDAPTETSGTTAKAATKAAEKPLTAAQKAAATKAAKAAKAAKEAEEEAAKAAEETAEEEAEETAVILNND